MHIIRPKLDQNIDSLAGAAGGPASRSPQFRQPRRRRRCCEPTFIPSPFVFAIVQSGPVEIFLNARGPAIEEYPAFAGKPIGGTLTLYCEVTGIQRIHDELKSRVEMKMPLEKKWYGVTEFAFEDPDGYVITFGERNE